MGKVIRVPYCEQCPHSYWDEHFNIIGYKECFRCDLTRKDLTNVVCIPDDCPLDDDNEMNYDGG